MPRPLHSTSQKLTNAWPLTPKHSGDLGVATKEPRKGRPAAIGRELLRLVSGRGYDVALLPGTDRDGLLRFLAPAHADTVCLKPPPSQRWVNLYSKVPDPE